MLKGIFGVLGLLIALAVIGILAKNQLSALGVGGAARNDAPQASGIDGAGNAVRSTPGDARAQTQAIQNDVRDRVNQSLQQGADRSEREQP